jgi:protein-disulfide isomerase
MRALSACTLALLAMSTAAVAPAQSYPDTSRPAATVEADLARIRSDIETVKAQLVQVLRLLSERPAGAGAPVAPSGPLRTRVADSPSLGRAEAPVTIVEFSDYQCPFCQRFAATTLPALKAAYVDSGRVRYVFRDHPLDQLHPQARKAAEAAHCAGEQGKYWEMHDALFANQRAMAPAQLAEHARAIGADAAAFSSCLESGRHAARVERDLADGAAAGVRGTPYFVIGRTGADGIVEGMPIRGAQPIEVFRRAIEAALAQDTLASRKRSPGGTP